MSPCEHDWFQTAYECHRRPVHRCRRCGHWLKAHAWCAGTGFLEDGPGADRFCEGCGGSGLVIVATFRPMGKDARTGRESGR